VLQLEKNLRPVVERAKGAAKPTIYALQRHYPTQRSPLIDARLEADLRTLVPGSKAGVKHQPQWIEAIYEALCNKRSNIQLGVQVHFRYNCPMVRSRKALDLFAHAWIAMWPLVRFVLDD